jgi:SAM-dependent methyltransferase
VDRDLLRNAYDRSAEDYDARFRDLQRTKFRVAAPFLGEVVKGEPCLDAGGGSGLFQEWLALGECPGLAGGRWLLLDLSLAMARRARDRRVLVLIADLSRPPLRPRSFARVVAFTSILGERAAALAALGRLLAPGGELCVSFLAAESPPPDVVARESRLRVSSGPIPAGQDVAFVLHFAP